MAGRDGHGLGGSSQHGDAVRCARRGKRRRNRDGRKRHDRHRHRQLHSHGTDRRRDAWRAIDKVIVTLGDSRSPVSAGSVGQWGGNSAAAGVYAACVKLCGLLAQRAGFNVDSVTFDRGRILSDNRSVSLSTAAGAGGAVAEDVMQYGDLSKTYAQAAFGAFFCEVGVNRATSEVRVRRMLGVFAAGRILNPKTACSQLIGGMTMGIGSALMEESVVDTWFAFFVNHDFAEYHIPAHADVLQQDVIFIDELDDKSSPMKAKGVGELGICGSAASVANAVYNACGARVREYPLTLDKIQTARDLA